MIRYTNLYKTIHKLLFLGLPLPLLLSHEMISYLSWFLIFLYLLKLQSFRKKSQGFEKVLILFSIAFFIMVSFLSLYLIFNTKAKNNLDDFQSSLLSFKFLFHRSRFNICLFMTFILKLGLFLELFKKSFYFQTFLIFFLSSSFFIIFFLPFSVFQEFFFTSDYFSRVYPPVISLPFCLLMWVLAELKQIKLQSLSKSFLWSCCILSLSFTIYRIKSDLEFYNYQESFSRHLENCEGFISVSSFKKNFPYLRSNAHWKITAESLILPQRRTIKAVLFNDFCEKTCKKHRFKLVEDCSSSCKRLSFGFPDIFSDESLKKHSFFNFQPLIKNWESQENFCQKVNE